MTAGWSGTPACGLVVLLATCRAAGPACILARVTSTITEHDPRWEVRESGIDGRGAFAVEAIPAGALVAEYRGRRITKSESVRECEAGNPYIFTLDDEWDLDGNVESNPARFINHSCAPNCEVDIQDGRILIQALRDIAPGEELSFNYGYDLEDYHEQPCRCGVAQCVGFIVAEELFPEVRQKELTRLSGTPGDRPVPATSSPSPVPAA